MKQDFSAYWFIYLSMPFVAAFVGWSTKIVALEMLYRPVEFKGWGPFGWQGIVPRRAGKVGSKTIDLTTDAMAFVRRSGIYFGLVIGLVQMVAWALFKNPWIMPAFGFAVGFISDYIALNMLFRPVRPRKFLGFIPFQGLLHDERDKITRDYAKILADDLFAPEIMFDAIIKGPGSDKLFALAAKEIDAAIDAQTGVARPVVTLAVGTKRYRALKDRVVAMVLERLPDTLLEAQDYAMSVIDLENTIVEKMSQLTNEEYESILRPVFKDDEPLMIGVGAVLGGVVGEIQVQIIELFTH
ncbi:MAG: DUF445 domain-containing protein [Mycobacterium sp.]